MENSIKNFAEQFKWEPQIINPSGQPRTKWVVCGMGGSHLAAGLLKVYQPALDLLIHRDYGLPRAPEYFLKDSLIILSSYSGNTEEVLDAARLGLEQKLNLAVITTGGKLLDLAKASNLSYIQLPATDIQPRMALGYSLKALAKLIGSTAITDELTRLADRLELVDLASAGENLAAKIKGKIPLIYASTLNLALAYNWKIKLNETGKTPAFYNVVPELNHNEMIGFDGLLARSKFNQEFYAIFLTTFDDDARVTKRFEVLASMYQARGVSVERIPLTGASIFERIFNSLILADWAAFYTAKLNGNEPELVPMIEEFKKLIG